VTSQSKTQIIQRVRKTQHCECKEGVINVEMSVDMTAIFRRALSKLYVVLVMEGRQRKISGRQQPSWGIDGGVTGGCENITVP
jgi:hypothetical protein